MTVTVSELAVELLGVLGPVGVFAVMILENIFVPLPSEVVLVFTGFLVYRGRFSFAEALAAATLGSLLSSALVYYMGYSVGRVFVEKYGRYLGLSERHLASAEEFFRARGEAAVFIGRLVPAVRSVISFPAGVARMSPARFLAFTALGSALWNTALILAGYYLGESWALIKEYSQVFDAVGLAALLLLAALYIRRAAAKAA